MRTLIPILLGCFLVGCTGTSEEQQQPPRQRQQQQDKEFVDLVEQFIEDARRLSNTDLVSNIYFRIDSPRLRSSCDTAENKVRIWNSGTSQDSERFQIASKMKGTLMALSSYAISMDMIRMARSKSEVDDLTDKANEAQNAAKTSIDELERLLETYRYR